MTPLRYLTPFLFLVLLPLGAWLGGVWIFLPAIITPLGLIALDAALGPEKIRSKPESGRIPRWFPRAYIVLQLVTTFWVAVVVASPSTPLLDAFGLTLSTGVTTGVFGFLAAHEMVHSPDRRERALGLILLGSVLYMHFRIAHIHGHHRRAATPDDPATAKLGESLYAFLPRTVAGQFREAWQFESHRLLRIGQPVLGVRNRMLWYIFAETFFLLAVALANVRALFFLIAVAAIAVALLETFNYVAHYGLRRSVGPDGRVERLSSQHSWNSVRRMNNAALFNMGRHSDHHRVMTKSYEGLEPVSGAAELPSGYASALVMALVPPLWRRVMDGRVHAAMAGNLQAGTP
jgi:alkane 1-monooxygenase